MTANKRIILNVTATYGRSLYALVVGLFCGRWTLMVLGEVDYGLMGLVGGLAGFVSFFNNILASAVARYYAFAVGQSQIAGREDDGLDECWHWFNTALTVHTVVPLILLIVGYPVGEWAVRSFLTIPPDRVMDCVWVWRFVCVSCFVSMISVPFSAMYNAKQYIAELTVYAFATTTLNACFLYYMVSHPGIWLAKFALFTCVIAVVPQAIIAVRAMLSFPECKIRLRYMGEFARIKQVCQFAGWQFFGILGGMLRGQGIQLVVNKFFGPAMNAGMAVGSQVNSHALTLAGAMQGAFGPAITNACGAGDMHRMRTLSYRVCKFGMALSLIFVLPLLLEMSAVLTLWLKNPPSYAVEFCFCILIIAIVDKATVGHMMAVNAIGKIAAYQFVVGLITISSVPVAIVLTYAWRSPLAIMVALFVVSVVAMLCRVWMARSRAGLSAWVWFKGIMAPVFVAAILAAGFGCIPCLFMTSSLARIAITTACCEIVYLPLVWFVIFDCEEREYLTERIKRLKRW